MSWKVLLIRKNGKIITLEFLDHPHPELHMLDADYRQNVSYSEAGSLGRATFRDLRFKIYACRDSTLFYEEI